MLSTEEDLWCTYATLHAYQHPKGSKENSVLDPKLRMYPCLTFFTSEGMAIVPKTLNSRLTKAKSSMSIFLHHSTVSWHCYIWNKISYAFMVEQTLLLQKPQSETQEQQT